VIVLDDELIYLVTNVLFGIYSNYNQIFATGNIIPSFIKLERILVQEEFMRDAT
jgi:hypothetical protein